MPAWLAGSEQPRLLRVSKGWRGEEEGEKREEEKKKEAGRPTPRPESLLLVLLHY